VAAAEHKAYFPWLVPAAKDKLTFGGNVLVAETIFSTVFHVVIVKNYTTVESNTGLLLVVWS
jgi:hypothetical protein